MADVDLKQRESFAHWVTVTLRYSDQDAMGHINNVVYGAYLAEGRNGFVGTLLKRLGPPGVDFVVASVKIDYLQEMRYPGSVEVGSTVLRIGNKSLTLGHALFKDGARIAAAESVLVFIDKASGRTVPVPEGVRAELTRMD